MIIYIWNVPQLANGHHFYNRKKSFTELLGTPGYLAPEMLQVSIGNPEVEGYGKEIDMWVSVTITFH